MKLSDCILASWPPKIARSLVGPTQNRNGGERLCQSPHGARDSHEVPRGGPLREPRARTCKASSRTPWPAREARPRGPKKDDGGRKRAEAGGGGTRRPPRCHLHLKEGEAAPKALARRRRGLCVVVLPEQPSYRKPGTREVPDVEVQVPGALLRATVGHLHVDLSKVFPLRCRFAHVPRAEMETAHRLRIHPRPRDVQLLEVHVRALSTQSTRVGHYTKQCVVNTLTPWNVNQNLLARPHQVEPFAEDVLQMRVACGTHNSH